MISKASGFLGSLKEYFDNTFDSLSELNITDTEMSAISNYFEKIK
jgi:cation transport regulator ChaC